MSSGAPKKIELYSREGFALVLSLYVTAAPALEPKNAVTENVYRVLDFRLVKTWLVAVFARDLVVFDEPAVATTLIAVTLDLANAGQETLAVVLVVETTTRVALGTAVIAFA